MERYGLVRLHKGERGRLRPEVPYRDVQIAMQLLYGVKLFAVEGDRKTADLAVRCHTVDNRKYDSASCEKAPTSRRQWRT